MDKNDPRQELASLFREARGQATQEDFADKLGITQTHLSRMEAGKTPPSAELVGELAKNSRISAKRAFDLLEEVRALETKEEIAKVRARISEARAT